MLSALITTNRNLVLPPPSARSLQSSSSATAKKTNPLISLRNVGELAGVLSDTYIPTLDPEDEEDEGGVRRKQRKRYGKGRFKFPSYTRDDEDEDDDDDSTGGVSSDDDDDEDTHGVVSLFAKEIMRQKMMETQRKRGVDLAGAVEVRVLTAAMREADDDDNCGGGGGGGDVADETKALHHDEQPTFIAHHRIPTSTTTATATATATANRTSTIAAAPIPATSGDSQEDQEDPQVI